MSSGTLALSGAGALAATSAVNVQAGTFDISAITAASETIGSLAGASGSSVVLGAKNLTAGGDNSSTAFAGVLSGATGSFTKTGAGTLTLSGANTFGGNVTINGGAISVATWNNSSTNGVWGNSSSLIQMNGGRINYTGGSVSAALRGVNLVSGNNTIDVISGSTLNFAGSNIFQSNGGNLIKEGLGTLQLGSTGVLNNIFTGKVAINAGTLDWFGSGSMPVPASLVSDFITINNGGTFALSYTGGSTLSANIGFNVSGSAGISTAGPVTIAGVIADGASSGGLTKSGNGTLTLTGANTYTGTTTVSAGTLALSNILALQNSALDTSGAGNVTASVTTLTLGGLSGSKDLGSVITTGYSSVTGITLNPGIGFTNSYSGNITNGASGMTLTKSGAGTQILSGANTYSGQTTISAGTLLVNNGTGSGTGSGTVSVSTGATLGGNGTISGAATLNGATIGTSANTLTLANTLTSTGSSNVASGSTVNVAGAKSVTSGTLLIDGTLGGSGSTSVSTGATIGGTGTIAGALTVSSGGFLAPGALNTGTFTTTGSLSLANTATYNFELNSSTLAADKIFANGLTLASGSVFHFADLGGGTIAQNTVFVAIDNTSGSAISGMFSGFAEGATFTVGANRFQASYVGGNGNDFTLTVVPEPATWALLAFSLTTVMVLRRRRNS